MTRSEKLRLAASIAVIVLGFTLIILVFAGAFDHGDGVTPPNRTGVTRAAPESGAYIGSIETKKFHIWYCSYLPDAENQIPFASREEALAAGYDPCGHCKP